jgi:drug/metabolite transporter (DMT)-like permease
VCTLRDNLPVSALVLSLVAALGYGVSDFVGGLAARRTAVLSVLMVSYPVGFVGLLVIAPLVGGRLTVGAIVIGGAAGLVSGLAIIWFYAALASGPMSVVSPLTSLLVAGLPLGVGIAWGERPGPLAIAGALLAVVAVVLVSRQEHTAVDEESPVRFTPKVAWLTVGSGAAFAVYFVLLDRVGTDTGLWPLVTSRASATLLIVIVGLATGARPTLERGPIRLALGAAALDIVANTAFLAALRAGMLAIVSVLTSLYPAGTVLLARFVLKERTGWLQRVGLVLAAAGVVLIAGAPTVG